MLAGLPGGGAGAALEAAAGGPAAAAQASAAWLPKEGRPGRGKDDSEGASTMTSSRSAVASAAPLPPLCALCALWLRDSCRLAGTLSLPRPAADPPKRRWAEWKNLGLREPRAAASLPAGTSGRLDSGSKLRLALPADCRPCSPPARRHSSRDSLSPADAATATSKASEADSGVGGMVGARRRRAVGVLAPEPSPPEPGVVALPLDIAEAARAGLASPSPGGRGCPFALVSAPSTNSSSTLSDMSASPASTSCLQWWW